MKSGYVMSRKTVMAAVLAVVVGGCGGGLTDAEHLERAQQFQSQQDWQSSVIELKNALQKNPDNPGARLLLGQAYLELENGAAAEKELQRALELGMARAAVIADLAKALLLQRNYAELIASLTVRNDWPAATQAKVHVLRGQALLAQNQAEQAAEEFQAAVQAQADSVDAWYGQALLAYSGQDWDEAHVWLDKILEKQKTNAQALTLKGDVAMAQQDFAAAEQFYRQIADARPWNLAYRIALASAQLNNKKTDAALIELDKALKAFPNNPTANYLRTLAAYQQQDFQNAKLYAEKTLNLEEQDLRSRLLAAHASFMLKQYEQAHAHLKRFIARVPDYESALKLLAAIQLHLGDDNKAIATLQQVTAGPEDQALLSAIGTAALRGGDLRSGQSAFEKLVGIAPDSAAAKAQLGLIRVKLGDYEQGTEDLQQALALDPDFEAADVQLILTYLNAQDYPKALEAARQLQSKQPDSPLPLNLLGGIYLGMNDTTAARQQFETALTKDPANPSAAHNLAALALQAGDKNTARTLYEEVLQKHPDNLRNLLLLAELEINQGARERATELLAQAMQAHPEAPAVRLMQGRALLLTGQAQPALALAEELLKADPHYADALALQGQAQLALNQPQPALNTLQQLVSERPQSAQAHYLLASAYTVTGERPKLKAALEQALALDPQHFDTQVALMRLAMVENQPEEANRLVQALRQQYPDRPEIDAHAGWLALQQRQPQEALAAYRKAYQQLQTTALTLEFAQAHWLAGEQQQALSLLENWYAQHPADLQVATTLANLYLATQQGPKAVPLLEKLVEATPDNVTALNSLAWHLREREPERALNYARRANQLAPNEPLLMDTLGMILLQRGDVEAALAQLRQAVAKAPENQTLRYHLAQALTEAGQRQEARALLEDVLKQSGSFQEDDKARALLEQLRQG